LKHSPVLSLIDLQKTYGQLHALDHVSFEMVEGEIVAILGPSGSGKSTLLMVIAGLERPDREMFSGKELPWPVRPLTNGVSA
jgi:ABC-type Fe3+/spermidine/putrescine transport system ATPase subunit